MYCGNWHRGQRHGVGIYTSRTSNDTYGCVNFTGTWRRGVRVGPFQLSFGSEDKSTTLHGTWDNLYPQGPSVFSFDNRFLLMGYFQTPGCEAWMSLQAKKDTQVQESFMEENTELEETETKKQDIWWNEPSIWYAQEMCTYNASLLPQEPVPLPLSDSDISVCSLSTAKTQISIEKPFPSVAEAETEIGAEEDLECGLCECSSSGVESSSQICPPYGNPCAIEISDKKTC